MNRRELPRIVYLGGLGRSGSTLLERLLGELPGVCSAGEIVHLWQRGIAEGERCGCGEPFGRCPFWSGVGRAGFGGWDMLDPARVGAVREMVDRTRFIPLLATGRREPMARRGLAEYLGYYQRVYSAIAQVSGCPTIVDSSKHASLAFCLRRCSGLDLRVIHLVRDSRAVAHSWSRLVARPDSAATTHMTTYSPARAAGHWNAQNGALQLLARLGTPTLLVRYEDLVSAPRRVLTEISAFAGIPAGDHTLRFLGTDGSGPWAHLGTAHTASGNPMRFTTGRLAIRRDDRWRTAMPAGQRGAVTALTIPLLARYGYLRRVT